MQSSTVSGFLNVVIDNKGTVILDQSMIMGGMNNQLGLNRSMDSGSGLIIHKGGSWLGTIGKEGTT